MDFSIYMKIFLTLKLEKFLWLIENTGPAHRKERSLVTDVMDIIFPPVGIASNIEKINNINNLIRNATIINGREFREITNDLNILSSHLDVIEKKVNESAINTEKMAHEIIQEVEIALLKMQMELSHHAAGNAPLVGHSRITVAHTCSSLYGFNLCTDFMKERIIKTIPMGFEVVQDKGIAYVVSKSMIIIPKVIESYHEAEIDSVGHFIGIKSSEWVVMQPAYLPYIITKEKQEAKNKRVTRTDVKTVQT